MSPNLTKPAPPKLMTSRFEMKYLVSEAKAEALIQYLKPLLTQDAYSEKQSDGFYPISSLYLDSDDLKLCRESLDGKKNRFKLRVRTYADASEAPIFLEIKRRMNAVILKNRSRSQRQEVAALLNHVIDGPTGGCDDSTKRQFYFYLRSIFAKPKVLIRYWRKAYMAGPGHQVRLTFDRDLSFKPMAQPKVELNGAGWYRVPLPGQIMEIKFNCAYPAWITEAVRRFGLQTQSVSKYTLGLRQASQLRLAANLGRDST